MSSNDTLQPSSPDKSDWSSAWQAVTRLATARESLQDIARTHSSSRTENQVPGSAVGTAQRATSDEQDQLAGAIAEIEEASAALRRSEPLLEDGVPAPPLRANTRGYWSVWLLIGAIWISASCVVATATTAILYILG